MCVHWGGGRAPGEGRPPVRQRRQGGPPDGAGGRTNTGQGGPAGAHALAPQAEQARWREKWREGIGELNAMEGRAQTKGSGG